MAGQTWTTIQNAVIVALAQAPSPYNVANIPDFTTQFAQAASYAELRIYRDLVMLCTRMQNTSLGTTGASRQINLANMTNPNGGPIIVPEGLSLITPSGTANPANGTRVQFTEASLDWIDYVWPVEATTMDPDDAEWIGRYWAMRDAFVMVISPTPDAVYTAEITGLFQPTPISPANPVTYLSTYYPDLLECAILIFLSGALQRNYGAQSDDPRQAQSWEAQYQTLKTGALNEEMRRRGLSPNAPSMPQQAQAR
jgi:hypothetical protein